MAEKRQAAGDKQNNYVKKNIKDEQERYIWEQLCPQKMS